MPFPEEYQHLQVVADLWQLRHPDVCVLFGPLSGQQDFAYCNVTMARPGHVAQTFQFEWTHGSSLGPRLLRMLNYRNRKWDTDIVRRVREIMENSPPSRPKRSPPKKDMTLQMACSLTSAWAKQQDPPLDYSVMSTGRRRIEVFLKREGWTSPRFELEWQSTSLRKDIQRRLHAALTKSLNRMGQSLDVWDVLNET